MLTTVVVFLAVGNVVESVGRMPFPNVTYNVVRRIFPHAAENDVVQDINECNNTEIRKDIVEVFVENKFGLKLSMTDSPFDNKEYALHKMWSLVDQRQALVAFFELANEKLQETITMGLANELFELFFVLDVKYDHLFPAAMVAWIESVSITLSYTDLLEAKKWTQVDLVERNPDAAYHLLYWQLYDQYIETNVLFI